MSPEEFKAIKAEALRRIRQEDPTQGPWTSLDQSKMRRLLLMPELATIQMEARDMLVDQAAAWDLLDFDKPSDIVVMYERWYPDSNLNHVLQPGDSHTVTKNLSWEPKPDWGRTSSAGLALINCMPEEVWEVQDKDPMVWALQHPSGWFVDNESDTMGRCIRLQRERSVQWPAVSEKRGASSAAVLQVKLADFLMANRCRGHGPDSCLPLLNILVTLGRDNPKLPGLIKVLEPEFELDLAEIPPPLLDAKTAQPDIKALEALQDLTMRQLIFLVAKLPVVLNQPEAWPPGELARLIHLSGQLNRRISQTSQRGGRTFSFWQRSYIEQLDALPSDAEQTPEEHRQLQEVATKLASAADCNIDAYAGYYHQQQFWMTYALARLSQDQESCSVLQKLGVGDAYGAVIEKNQTNAMAPFAALQPFVKIIGHAHDEVVAALGIHCPIQGPKPEHDPWQICDEVRANWQAEQARENPPAPPPPPKQPGECADGIQDAIENQLEIDDNNNRFFTCSTMTSNPLRSIVAYAHLPSSQAYDQNDTVSGDYDLDVMIVNSDSGRIISHLHQAKAYASDADRFADLKIDVTTYSLGNGLKGFGLLANHYNPAHMSGSDDTMLSLYVVKGAKIIPVMGKVTLAYQHTESDMQCSLDEQTYSTTIELGHSYHHGMRDIVIKTLNVENEGQRHGMDCEESSNQPLLTTFTLRFDGKHYPLPANLTLY